nr:hypothetical protein [Tanacetum cinerariifolium]
SEGDIIYLENLLTYDTIPSLLSKMFLDHDPKVLKDEPNDDDLNNSPFLLSSGSEDTIFDPGISAFLFLVLVASHRSGTFISFNVYPNIFNESPMEICSSTRFNPNITMIWGLPRIMKTPCSWFCPSVTRASILSIWESNILDLVN